MELGNICFGCSRGEGRVPRDSTFEAPWNWMCQNLNIDSYGFPEKSCPVPTEGRGIGSDVFHIEPYYWGDCDCSVGDDDEEHKPQCSLIQPNFLYKPTGFQIQWYKYPFRDSYMTPRITPQEWLDIIKNCLHSVKG